jgi:hypothetical protein
MHDNHPGSAKAQSVVSIEDATPEMSRISSIARCEAPKEAFDIAPSATGSSHVCRQDGSVLPEDVLEGEDTLELSESLAASAQWVPADFASYQALVDIRDKLSSVLAPSDLQCLTEKVQEGQGESLEEARLASSISRQLVFSAVSAKLVENEHHEHEEAHRSGEEEHVATEAVIRQSCAAARAGATEVDRLAEHLYTMALAKQSDQERVSTAAAMSNTAMTSEQQVADDSAEVTFLTKLEEEHLAEVLTAAAGVEGCLTQGSYGDEEERLHLVFQATEAEKRTEDQHLAPEAVVVAKAEEEQIAHEVVELKSRIEEEQNTIEAAKAEVEHLACKFADAKKKHAEHECLAQEAAAAAKTAVQPIAQEAERRAEEERLALEAAEAAKAEEERLAYETAEAEKRAEDERIAQDATIVAKAANIEDPTQEQLLPEVVDNALTEDQHYHIILHEIVEVDRCAQEEGAERVTFGLPESPWPASPVRSNPSLTPRPRNDFFAGAQSVEVLREIMDDLEDKAEQAQAEKDSQMIENEDLKAEIDRISMNESHDFTAELDEDLKAMLNRERRPQGRACNHGLCLQLEVQFRKLTEMHHRLLVENAAARAAAQTELEKLPQPRIVP